jgi:magnesium transporter
MNYDAVDLEERTDPTPEEAAAARRPGRVVWLDIQGLGDERLLRRVGQAFAIHPLALADVVNVGHRPKVEEYEGHLFWILRMATPADHTVLWEQVSMFVGPGLVLTFQERHGDCLDPVRDRIRKVGSSLRSGGADYLASMILDGIVDGYFPVLESWGDRLEAIETRVIDRPEPEVLRDIFRAKREIMTFRRAVWPLRDEVSRLIRDGHDLITPTTVPYLRDVSDHVTQIFEIIETERDLAAGFVDVYLSSVSNRTNEVMRVLTVLASIFIPLTFLSGVYGMNFDTDHPLNMPELHWKYGYLAFIGLCALITVALLLLFRRLGWLGGKRRR